MKDFFLQPLKEGDEVAYLDHTRTSSRLRRGTVVGFSNTMVRVSGAAWDGSPGLKSADKIIKRPA